MRNAVLMPLHLDAFVGQNLTFSHQISVQLKTSEHFRAHFLSFGLSLLKSSLSSAVTDRRLLYSLEPLTDKIRLS